MSVFSTTGHPINVILGRFIAEDPRKCSVKFLGGAVLKKAARKSARSQALLQWWVYYGGGRMEVQFPVSSFQKAAPAARESAHSNRTGARYMTS